MRGMSRVDRVIATNATRRELVRLADEHQVPVHAIQTRRWGFKRTLLALHGDKRIHLSLGDPLVFLRREADRAAYRAAMGSLPETIAFHLNGPNVAEQRALVDELLKRGVVVAISARV